MEYRFRGILLLSGDESGGKLVPKLKRWLVKKTLHNLGAAKGRGLKRNKPFVIFKNGCWEWGHAIHSNGYGEFRHPSNKFHYAHRFFYEFFIEKIPKGTVIDHLCRNRKCCNPYHLEVVTQKENIRRGRGNGGVLMPEEFKGVPLKKWKEIRPDLVIGKYIPVISRRRQYATFHADAQGR